MLVYLALGDRDQKLLLIYFMLSIIWANVLFLVPVLNSFNLIYTMLDVCFTNQHFV